MTSQLLLGEVVRRVGRPVRGGWWRVENLTDRYEGWVRDWGVVPTTGARAGSWRRRARARVAVPFAEVRSRPGSGGSVSPLPLNARVIPGKRTGRWRAVELPDGRRGFVPAGILAAPGDPPPGLVRRIRGLLGVPYLWGGRTPAGFDCSGFTQQVLAERGFGLPRDAAHQYEACRPLGSGGEPALGDLLFFRDRSGSVTHVGIALGGGFFAHARGRVRIASLEDDNPLYDSEIAAQFAAFRTPQRGRRRGAVGGQSA
jgi:hypothetical protein